MTRTPRRCLLAAGLAAFALPAAATPAVSGSAPFVERPALFPDAAPPRSRLLFEGPASADPAPPPTMRKPSGMDASPRHVTAPTAPPKPIASPRRQAAPAESASAAPPPAPVKPAAPQREPLAASRPEAKPQRPDAPVPAPAPSKPLFQEPPEAQSALPDVKPKPPVAEPAITVKDTAPAPEQQTPEAAPPAPPPLPDLPPQETPEVAEAPPTPDPKPAPQDQGMAQASLQEAQAPAPQQAALPPTAIDQLTVPFAPDSADPPRDAVRSLSALAAMLAENDALRLRLNAYAPGATAEESRSRRLSLSRALAVRSRLVDAGISSTRIEVRALGNAATEGPLDRVDVIVLER